MASISISIHGLLEFFQSLIKAIRINESGAETLPRYLLAGLWENPGDRKAVVTSTGTVSFEVLSERSVRLANSFYNQGLKENDRVAVLVKNEQAWKVSLKIH